MHPEILEPVSAAGSSGDDFVTCEVSTFAGTFVIEAPDLATLARNRDELLTAISRALTIAMV